MRITVAVALTPFIMLAGITSDAAAQTSVPLEILLTPAQYRSAGLQKLTQIERDSLSRYVTDYSQMMARQLIQLFIATPGSAARPRDSLSTPPVGNTSSQESVESRIDGEFTGWDGDTVFRLQNGQVWKQLSYAYVYHFAYAPDVLIYPSGASFKMRVDGVAGSIIVQRLR